MLLMDVNILVYAHRQDVKNHLKFKTWLEDVINSNSAYGYSELVLSGFLRVVTNPGVFEEPGSLEMALSFANQFRLQTNAVCVAPGNRHWVIFQNLLESTNAKGNLIPDAYHAALAIESGSEWVTTDKGFKRFKGLKFFNPLH
jgi:toxin-antitoxin system PIN domain toxin